MRDKLLAGASIGAMKGKLVLDKVISARNIRPNGANYLVETQFPAHFTRETTTLHKFRPSTGSKRLLPEIQSCSWIFLARWRSVSRGKILLACGWPISEFSLSFQLYILIFFWYFIVQIFFLGRLEKIDSFFLPLSLSISFAEVRPPTRKNHPVVVEFSIFVVDINSINVEDMDFRWVYFLLIFPSDWTLRFSQKQNQMDTPSRISTNKPSKIARKGCESPRGNYGAISQWIFNTGVRLPFLESENHPQGDSLAYWLSRNFNV